jgi:hypothetical protein
MTRICSKGERHLRLVDLIKAFWLLRLDGGFCYWGYGFDSLNLRAQ